MMTSRQNTMLRSRKSMPRSKRHKRRWTKSRRSSSRTSMPLKIKRISFATLSTSKKKKHTNKRESKKKSEDRNNASKNKRRSRRSSNKDKSEERSARSRKRSESKEKRKENKNFKPKSRPSSIVIQTGEPLTFASS